MPGRSAIPTLDDRLEDSRAKIHAPYVLDDSLRLYSPQDNVDALRHPRVRSFARFVTREYEPRLPPGRAIALLIPCTKHKPYPTSIEHRRINAALLGAGFGPSADLMPASALLSVLGSGEDPTVLNVAPLVRGETVVHRYVVSEPLGLVPYEFVYEWRGAQSVATSYDDPGLFEHRGTSVAPWRADSTATPSRTPGKWSWGDNERAAYVTMHDALSAQIAETLVRLRDRYERRVAWVAPGLTHRSFMMAAGDRATEGVPSSRRANGQRLPLHGVNDVAPGLVEIHPTRAEAGAALARLKARLTASHPRISDRAVQAIYARGGGGATPLALPELLDDMVALLTR